MGESSSKTMAHHQELYADRLTRPTGRPAASARRERRVMWLLLALYCVFIAYGSFIPFRFTAEPHFDHLSKGLFRLFEDGRRLFSLPDVLSNVLLFVPFGFLLAGTGRRRGGKRSAASLLLTGSAALAFSTAIEVGQLFVLGRIGSPVDVAANTLGALAGAMSAFVLFPAAEGRLQAWAGDVARREPRLFPMALLLMALAADSFYPFAVTLDVSTAWHNLRHGQWMPLESFGRRFWADLVMDKGVMFALLAALVQFSLARRVPRLASRSAAWGTTVLAAVGLEGGKLFFVGRAPNVDNVILAGAGALAGVTLIPAMVRSGPVRARPALALLLVASALAAYAELTPFDFALAPSAIAAKVDRIEWLPLHSHVAADPPSALFDLGNKLLLAGFLGYAAASALRRGSQAGLVVGLVAGATLEVAQLLKVTRLPGVTDVMIFGAGAYVGGAVYQGYQRFRRESLPTAARGER